MGPHWCKVRIASGYRLGAIQHQAIIWTLIDQVSWHHVVSPGPSKLMLWQWWINQCEEMFCFQKQLIPPVDSDHTIVTDIWRWLCCLSNVIFSSFPVKLPSCDCHRTLLMMRQNWFRQWFDCIKQQAITWTNVDHVTWCRMASFIIMGQGLNSRIPVIYWHLNNPLQYRLCLPIIMLCQFCHVLWLKQLW